MHRGCGLAGLVFGALLLAGGAGAQVVAVDAAMPVCLSPAENALVAATVTPDLAWSNVRTYFREAGATDFYYVEMRSEAPGAFWAALPLPEADTAAADLYVMARDAEGREYRGELVTVPATAECECALTPAQAQYADNLVIGETVLDQAGAPLAGFQCEGIISRIGADGELREDEACRRILLAAAAPDGYAAAAGGAKKWVVPLAIVGGVAAAAILIEDDDEPEVSPAR